MQQCTEDQACYKVSISTMQLHDKIPPGSPLWQTFNGSFHNERIPHIELANAIYTGHAITTWHDHHWRNAENYLAGQHLGLDFDTKDKRSSLAHLANDPFIKKYAALVYTTPSHTPEAPKARVIFTLEREIHQAKNYALAASALLWLFDTADRQCKDACRFFYGSIDCEIEYLANVLPMAVLLGIIEDYKEMGQIVKRKVARQMDQPLPDHREVAEALDRIPPNGIDYDEWVAVLMAIHSAFGDEGLYLGERWADGFPGEVESKWRSFKQAGNYAGRITIATLFGIAKRFGWRKI